MNKRNQPIFVIGGGLAGCEAAWQLARRGNIVTLCEMKPARFSPAHTSEHLAELVCSNSLRSNDPENAVGLLKEEMRLLASLIVEAADATAVPAGKALAVDRADFSRYIEQKLLSLGNLQIIRREVTELPMDQIAIIATGPLTSDALARSIAHLTDSRHLYFYDAIAPIVEGDSLDYERIFRASRYADGEGDYLNCPLEKDAYEQFWTALTEGACVPLKTFEDLKCFEGCLPVEVIAARGINTLCFGPMKPVGLIDPKTGRQPYAVVQLRKEDRAGTRFNMVGFQTRLTWPEQKRIFRMIPGLERATFARYGSMHRNTFINAPALLRETLQLRNRDNLFFAGQITGVEGYVESAAMGLISGISAACFRAGGSFVPPPGTTACGALVNHITGKDRKDFQPMNVNFGLFPPPAQRVPKKDRGGDYARRALADLKKWREEVCVSSSFGLPIIL